MSHPVGGDWVGTNVNSICCKTCGGWTANALHIAVGLEEPVGPNRTHAVSGVVAAASVGYAVSSVFNSGLSSKAFNSTLQDRKSLKVSIEKHRVIQIKTKKPSYSDPKQQTF